MKREILRAFVGLTLIAMFVTTASAVPFRLIMQIPFAFHVGNDVLDGGKYSFSVVNGNVLQIVSADRHKSIYNMTMPSAVSNPRASTLVFNRYGDDYFLSQVIWAGDEITRLLPPAGAELEIAKGSPAVRIVKLIAR